MGPGPKLGDIGEGAAEVAIVGAEHLGDAAAMALTACGIFDGIHEREGLLHLRQGDAVVPTFKKTAIAAIPVVTTVRSG